MLPKSIAPFESGIHERATRCCYLACVFPGRCILSPTARVHVVLYVYRTITPYGSLSPLGLSAHPLKSRCCGIMYAFRKKQ